LKVDIWTLDRKLFGHIFGHRFVDRQKRECSLRIWGHYKTANL